ncbi:holo-ACP synthase [Actinomadura sp. 9N215]|uniref:holo-ACP synthase n=1 Tax=Actinomadura sp. 9N215 TaxID=3375150 RepID=UPI0037A58A93
MRTDEPVSSRGSSEPVTAGETARAGGCDVRVGVDLAEVARVGRLLADHPGGVHELFTPREIAYCRRKRDQDVHFAGRFAAKEAVLKALGTGLGPRMRWTDVEVVNEALGRPVVRLHGEVAARANRRGLAGIDVSLSHSGPLAIAGVVTVWTGGGAPCGST